MVAEVNLGVAMWSDKMVVSENLTDGDIVDERQVFDFEAGEAPVVDDNFEYTGFGVFQNLQRRWRFDQTTEHGNVGFKGVVDFHALRG